MLQTHSLRGTFLKMGQPRPLLSFIFGLFQTNIIKNFTTKIYEKKCPSSIQCRDLNPRPSKNESPPAWPGLTPKRRDSHNKSIQLKLKKYFSDHLRKRSTLFRARLQKDGKRNLLLERGKFQNLWRGKYENRYWVNVTRNRCCNFELLVALCYDWWILYHHFVYLFVLQSFSFISIIIFSIFLFSNPVLFLYIIPSVIPATGY